MICGNRRDHLRFRLGVVLQDSFRSVALSAMSIAAAKPDATSKTSFIGCPRGLAGVEEVHLEHLPRVYRPTSRRLHQPLGSVRANASHALAH